MKLKGDQAIENKILKNALDLSLPSEKLSFGHRETSTKFSGLPNNLLELSDKNKQRLKNKTVNTLLNTRATFSEDRHVSNTISLGASIKLTSSPPENTLLRNLSATSVYLQTLGPQPLLQSTLKLSQPLCNLANPYCNLLLGGDSNNSNVLNLVRSTAKKKKEVALKSLQNAGAHLEKIVEFYDGEKQTILEDFPNEQNLFTVNFTFPISPISAAIDNASTRLGYELKIKFVNAVSGSLISLPNFSSLENEACQRIYNLAKEISELDPEFLLKVALYTRQDLNVRSTANFLLSCSAFFEECRPHLHKYFCASIQLPSDWIDVAEKFVKCLNSGKKSLPAALRKVMVKKFADFDEYQLAKYNKSKKKKLGKDNVDDFSLKKLIGQLHIVKPAYHVMCILGKRYPQSMELFHKSGLEGTWDSGKAGERMKLAIPNTWETQVSLHGNKAETWQKLLDSKALPYMATLRNLRNLLKSGISQKHHEMVIKYLTNKNAVAKSRQFPFRFLSAYEVLDDLLADLDKKVLFQTDGVKRFLPKDLKPHFGSKSTATKDKEARQKIQQLQRQLQNKYDDKKWNFTGTLVMKYQKALETSLDIATMCNLTPIKGHTMVLCDVASMEARCDIIGKQSKRTLLDIGLLLGLMCCSACEECTFLLYTKDNIHKVELEKGGMLSNLKSLTELCSCLENNPDSENFVVLDHLYKMLLDRKHVDNVILLCKETPENEEQQLLAFMQRYRAFVNNNSMFYQIQLSGKHAKLEESSNDKRNVKICGFSDHLLRFIAEGGGEKQVDYVETIDKQKNLQQKQEKSLEPIVNLAEPRLPIQETKQTIRVFVSSTLKDMQEERNLLSSFVFPELRRRASDLNLGIIECDLKWGIPQMERGKSRTVEICLKEVEKCQIFVGMLGDRYGWIPKKDDFPKDFEHVNTLCGKSITEIEIHQGALNCTRRAFFYIRAEETFDKLTKKQKKMFQENENKQKKLEELKDRVLQSGHQVSVYECDWTEMEGKLFASNLSELADMMVHDIWDGVVEINKQLKSSHVKHEVHLDHNASLESNTFVGRDRFMSSTVQILTFKQRLEHSTFMALCGPIGSGKTRIIQQLTRHYERIPQYCVLKYFLELSSEKESAKKLLDSLTSQLMAQLSMDQDTLGSSLKDSIDLFWYLVTVARQEYHRPVFIFIDDVDVLFTPSGGDNLQWLPQSLPDGIVLVVICMESSTAHSHLQQQRNDVIVQKIPSLNGRESAMMVRCMLTSFSKTLDERFFTNQLRAILLKRESTNPLYLKTVCDYIRMFADFSSLDQELFDLPHTLFELLQFWLIKLENLTRKSTLVSIFLSVIFCCPNGIEEENLFDILSFWMRTTSNRDLERSSFCQILHLVEGFLVKSDNGHKKLRYQHEIHKQAVYKRYLSSGDLNKTNCHKLLVLYHLHKSKDVKSSLQVLPYHIKMAGDRQFLVDYLSNFKILEAKCFQKLLWQLQTDFDLVDDEEIETKSLEKMSVFERLKSCINSSVSLIENHPSMIYQCMCDFGLTDLLQNSAVISKHQYDITPVFLQHVQEEIPSVANVRTLREMTKMKPTCLKISPDEDKLACGSEKAVLMIFSLKSGERLQVFYAKSFITCVSYISNDILVSGHSDGSISAWNCEDGFVITEIRAHTKQVSDMASDLNFGYLASISLDHKLHIWDTSVGKKQQVIGPLPSRSIDLEKMTPNCIESHPKKLCVAIGMWNCTIQIWNVVDLNRIAVLRGSNSSITNLQFSSDGEFLFSSGLNTVGVHIWSSASGYLLGRIGQNMVVNSMKQHGNWIIAGGNSMGSKSDGLVEVWKSSLGRKTSSLSNGKAESLCCTFNTNQTKVAVGYRNGSLSVFNAVTNKILTNDCFHQGAVRCVCFMNTKDENDKENQTELVLTGSDDRTISVFSCSSHKQVRRLEGHTGSINAIASNENFIASASEDFSIILWCEIFLSESPTPRYILRSHTAAPTCLSFGKFGFIASGGKDMSLIYWRIPASLSSNPKERSPNIVVNKAHLDWITCCSYSNTNGQVATGSNDCSVKIWSGKNLLHHLCAHKTFVTCVSFDCDFIASADKSGVLNLWSSNGVQISSTKCSSSINGCDMQVKIPKKPQIVFEELLAEPIKDWAAQAALDEWGTSHERKVTGKKRKEKSIGLENVESMVIATAHSCGEVGMWEPLEGELVSQMSGHTDTVTGVCCHDDQIFSCGSDGLINYWQLLEEQKENTIGHDKEITAMVQLGNHTISACIDGWVKIWSYEDNVMQMVCKEKAHSKKISGITVVGKKPNALCFVTSSYDGFLKSWKAVINESTMSLLDSIDLGNPIINQPPLKENKSASFLPCSMIASNVVVPVKKGLKFGKADIHNKETMDTWNLFDIGSILDDKNKDFFNLENNEFLTCFEELHNPSLHVFGSNNGFFYIKGKLTGQKIHDDKIVSMKSNEKYLITASYDRMIKIWERKTMKQVGYFMSKSSITHCLMNQQTGDIVYADIGGQIHILRLTDNLI